MRETVSKPARRTYGWRICSFVDAEGSAVVKGRTWRWEFHEYMGPTFVNAKGVSVDHPREDSPVWGAFNAWLWNHYTAKKNTRALAAMGQWYQPKAPLFPQHQVEP